jgi:heat shock protein HtpX
MAGFRAYNEAFRKVSGKKESVIGKASLKLEGTIAARKHSADSNSKESAVERAKEVTGLLDQIGGFLLISCACGLKIKIPPELGRVSLQCPRCGRAHDAHPRAPGTPPQEPGESPAAAPS